MNTRDHQSFAHSLMPDVQGSHDSRQIAIQRVGVRGIRHPLQWRAADGSVAPSIGEFSMAVALPADQKGTHMSRFIALIGEQGRAMDSRGVVALHHEMLRRLEADSGRITLTFPMFLRKSAPVSGVQSLMDYEVTFSVDGGAGAADAEITVKVPVTSLCPCSKTISDYGAHNQRSHVTVSVCARDPIAPEELIRLVEDESSCELWGLLKRVDEKYVTERAYDNPKFVEDLVRDVAARLSADPRIDRYGVEVENFESIHNHSAWARIDSD